jgi:nucleotide-binding universal stress UspA family protein
MGWKWELLVRTAGDVSSKRTRVVRRQYPDPGVPEGTCRREDQLGVTVGTRSHRVPAVSETGNLYRTVVVGTDGSESSLRAVTRAGAPAGARGATLVIACAFLPLEDDDREVARAKDALGDEAYQIVGSHPAEDTVRTAGERASKAGAQKVKTLAVQGSPVEALLDVVRREDADLLVVGNRGLAGIKGRLLGSVPADATRRSTCDVLVVHTTG